MIYHILNGDGLAQDFNLEGEIIICRECLIDGDLRAKNLNKLWKVRAEFIKNSYSADDYFEKVKGEFDKLNNLKPNDEVNLWFGNEAFCQVNMSFVLSLLADKNDNIFRVFPDSDDWNCSFENLNNCFETRQRLSESEVNLGKELFKAFCDKDFESLKMLSKTESNNFPHLSEICQALIGIDTKPKEILREITNNGETDFNKIFAQFKQKAAIYGYGDLQVKRLLDSI